MANSALATGAVNENAAHRFRRGGKEMGATLPLLIFIAGEPQPRFVNEGGGLQGLASRFVGHLVRGQAPQGIIHQGQQFIGGFRIALLCGLKNARNVAHNFVNFSPVYEASQENPVHRRELGRAGSGFAWLALPKKVLLRFSR